MIMRIMIISKINIKYYQENFDYDENRLQAWQSTKVMAMNKNRNMTLSYKHKRLVSDFYGSSFHDLQRLFMKNFIKFH